VDDPDGHVIPKILDFGISKLTQPTVPRITTDGAMLGTPNYMSPEQARGQMDTDARSDVFAAGILLYEMLSGANPFAHGSYLSVVAAILERDPQPLKNVSPEVWRVIKRALEKPPQLRYADAAELGAALRKAAQDDGVKAPDESGGYPAKQVSIGDRSVPPAPFREPDMTVPSMLVHAKRRARVRAAIFGGAMVTAFLVVAGLYARASHAPASVESAATMPAPPIDPASPAATATIAPAVETPDPAPAIVTTTPIAPTPLPQASAAVPLGTHVHAPTHAAAHAPKPAPSAGPSSAKSGVMRDPGF